MISLFYTVLFVAVAGLSYDTCWLVDTNPTPLALGAMFCLWLLVGGLLVIIEEV